MDTLQPDYEDVIDSFITQASDQNLIIEVQPPLFKEYATQVSFYKKDKNK